MMKQLDTSGPVFLEASRGPGACDIALVGVPFDGTASFRPGARFGPDAIRTASYALESYSPEQNMDLSDVSLVDFGNLIVGTSRPERVLSAVHVLCGELLWSGCAPLLLGGEHSFTPGAVSAAVERYPSLVLVQLDAHADLRESYLGERYSHACTMRRCLEHVTSESLLQVGIRSGTSAEWEEMRLEGRLVPPTLRDLRKRIATLAGRPIYLSIDLDVFDPAVMSGTGVPEPGGIDWATFEGLLEALQPNPIVAADVVELAPQYDPTGASSVLAAKVVRELGLLMSEGRDALDG